MRRRERERGVREGMVKGLTGLRSGGLARRGGARFRVSLVWINHNALSGGGIDMSSFGTFCQSRFRETASNTFKRHYTRDGEQIRTRISEIFCYPRNQGCRAYSIVLAHLSFNSLQNNHRQREVDVSEVDVRRRLMLERCSVRPWRLRPIHLSFGQCWHSQSMSV